MRCWGKGQSLTFNSEELGCLHWFLVQIIGDCVASPARDVTAMVMAIEREDQSTFGAKSSVRLQSDNWMKNLRLFLIKRFSPKCHTSSKTVNTGITNNDLLLSISNRQALCH